MRYYNAQRVHLGEEFRDEVWDTVQRIKNFPEAWHPLYASMRQHSMKAKKFEQQFDEGVDITASLDFSRAKRVLQEQKRVNVDFPTWMIESLDREAKKLGVTRQSIIKVWLAERLEMLGSNPSFKRDSLTGMAE